VLAVGTETDGSIVCPSGINGVVGIKPTLGVISRDGIIPVAHSQDTAGPFARTVTDAAILLAAMSGADPSDPATLNGPDGDWGYATGLSANALNGKRIGVLRNYWGAGDDPNVEAVFDQVIQTLEASGAEIVDPIEFSDMDDMWEAEDEVLNYEFKADLNAYLQSSGASVKSLGEVIRFNAENADAVMPFFGQELMEVSQKKGPLSEDAYLKALAESKRLSQTAIDAALESNTLDAIIAPTNSPAWLTDHINGDAFGLSSSSVAAVSGYASVTVPAGFVHGLPIGVSFIGGAYSDKQLIDMAYAFEQASKVRRAPEGL
jgi:amidase